jgi:hypothetical protein
MSPPEAVSASGPALPGCGPSTCDLEGRGKEAARVSPSADELDLDAAGRASECATWRAEESWSEEALGRATPSHPDWCRERMAFSASSSWRRWAAVRFAGRRELSGLLPIVRAPSPSFPFATACRRTGTVLGERSFECVRRLRCRSDIPRVRSAGYTRATSVASSECALDPQEVATIRIAEAGTLASTWGCPAVSSQLPPRRERCNRRPLVRLDSPCAIGWLEFT